MARHFARGRLAVQAPCHTRAAGHRMAGKCSPQHETICTYFRTLERRSGCSTLPPRQTYSVLAVLRRLVRSARPALRCFGACLNCQRVLRRRWFRKPASAPFRPSLPFYLDRQRVLRRLWFLPSPRCCQQPLERHCTGHCTGWAPAAQPPLFSDKPDSNSAFGPSTLGRGDVADACTAGLGCGAGVVSQWTSSSTVLTETMRTVR